MKFHWNRSFLTLGVGILLMGAAIFAEVIGLDKNPGGWGRARIGMFSLGLFIVLLVGLYYFTRQRIDRAAAGIYSGLQGHPLTGWLWKNETILRWSRFFSSYSFTIPLMAFILVLYIWLVSAGTWTEWVSPSRFYASLAKGFEYGMLSVTMEPNPLLAEIENPYDPANWRGKVQVPMDISYYKGRFHLYWGPTPAFLLYLLHPFYSGRVGDLQLAFFFISGIFLLQSILIIGVWDRFFSSLPRWMLQLSLLLGGLACPLTFMLAAFKGARIYEAAISGGQFFLLAGFVTILPALKRNAHLSSWRLPLAGIFWALAFGSRMPLIFPVAFLGLMVAYWLYKTQPSLLITGLKLLLLGLPLCVGLAAIFWYNWARFGSITESGLYYQMTAGLYLQKYNKEMADSIYILQNIYNYLFYPFDISGQFPFLSPRYASEVPVFSFYPLPELYDGQWITGLLWTVPFVVFAILPLVEGIRVFWGRNSLTHLSDEKRSEYDWLVRVMSGTFLIGFAFLLVFFWAAMRYLEDFIPFLLIVSMMGFWRGYQLLSGNPARQRLYACMGVVIACISMLNSTLLALSVNDARFVLLQFPG
jgi:hypothetical protein